MWGSSFGCCDYRKRSTSNSDPGLQSLPRRGHHVNMWWVAWVVLLLANYHDCFLLPRWHGATVAVEFFHCSTSLNRCTKTHWVTDLSIGSGQEGQSVDTRAELLQKMQEVTLKEQRVLSEISAGFELLWVNFVNKQKARTNTHLGLVTFIWDAQPSCFTTSIYLCNRFPEEHKRFKRGAISIISGEDASYWNYSWRCLILSLAFALLTSFDIFWHLLTSFDIFWHLLTFSSTIFPPQDWQSSKTLGWCCQWVWWVWLCWCCQVVKGVRAVKFNEGCIKDEIMCECCHVMRD